ncbi:hypothetical protein RJT34_17509 [Clitoria ternatea]|uniref:Cytochrome c oxidase copper chaperone n=1 Tax=Clitoria ternatea TaxID=43366 RepID=A0AAN9PD76_CLITE
MHQLRCYCEIEVMQCIRGYQLGLNESTYIFLQMNYFVWFKSDSVFHLLLFIIFRGFKMLSGVQLQSASPDLTLQGSKKSEGSVTVATGAESKPKKKICCACPDTKRLRDECIVEHGEAACAKWIEAHRLCLRAEGFNV